MDLDQAARAASVPYGTLKRWVHQGLVTCSENFGRGHGNGMRFSSRDVLAVRLLRALRALGLRLAAASAGARALQKSTLAPDKMCLVIYPLAPARTAAVRAPQLVPAGLLNEPLVLLVNVRGLVSEALNRRTKEAPK